MRSTILALAALLCAWPAQAQFAEPNERGVSFGHMHLVVADIELHKRLWPGVFGAELIEKEGYSAARVAGALIFFRDAEPTASSKETAIEHFGLKVRDINSVLAKWRALGYEVDSQKTDSSGQVVARITMPGGVNLALVEKPNQLVSTSMGHVQFVSAMADDLLAWYTEFFGTKTLARDGSVLAANVPGAELRFDISGKEKLPTEGTAIDHIGFEVQEWDAFIEMLREAGVQFEFGPVHVESLDLWVAFFTDPSGVLVEITHGLDHF